MEKIILNFACDLLDGLVDESELQGHGKASHDDVARYAAEVIRTVLLGFGEVLSVRDDGENFTFYFTEVNKP